MTLKEAITLDNFKTLWVIPNGNNFNEIAEIFYQYYEDEELSMNPAKLEVHWKLFVWPTIQNLNYEYNRWSLIDGVKQLNNTTTINGTNNSTSTNNITTTQNQNNNITTNDNSTIENTKTDGYGGYTIANQTGKYKTQTDNSTTTNRSTNESTATTNGTNEQSGTQNNTINSTTTNTYLNDIHNWLTTNFENISLKYFHKIANIIFVKIW